MVKTNGLLIKKDFREIKQNWPQFLATIMIAFLAITLFTGLTSSYQTLAGRLDLLYEETNMYDAVIDGGTQLITDSVYQSFANNENVDASEKRLAIYGQIDNRQVMLHATDEFPAITKPYTDNENVGTYIDTYTAETLGIAVGDTIDLVITKEYGYLIPGVRELVDSLPSSLIFTITIDEIMFHSEATQRGAMVPGVIWMDYETLHTYGKEAVDYYATNDLLKETLKSGIDDLFYYNQITIKCNNDEYISQIKDSSEYDIYRRNELSSHQAVDNDIVQGEKLTYVFPVIFFMVAVLVILTTTAQLIYREKTIIGTMKATGLSRRTILFYYARFPVLLVLIGGIIGAFVGPLIIPYVMIAKYDLLYNLPSISNVFPWIYSLGALLLMSFLAFFEGMMVCYREVKLTPALSMRGNNEGKTKYHRGLLKHRDWHGKIAFRNIMQKKARSLMVILGLLGCTALFVAGFGIDDTLDCSVEKEMKEYFPYDIQVTYANASMSPVDSIRDLDVTIEEYTKLNARVMFETIKESTIYIIEKDSQVFGQSIPQEGALLTSKIAEMIGAEINDTISVKVESTEYEMVVKDIFDSSLTQGIFVSKEYGADISSQPNQAWVLSDGDLASLTAQITDIEGVYSAYSSDDFKEMVDNIIGGIRIITITLKIFACLLAVVVLYNLAQLNYRERSRDIATMKVLGFNRLEIQKSLMLEMMSLTTIGSFLGLFLGMPILQLLLTINENEIITFIYDIQIKSYVFSFIFTFLTSLVVNLLLGKKISEIKMVESLKSVE